MHACLAATCHLHFWQNDRRDLSRATAVTDTHVDSESALLAVGEWLLVLAAHGLGVATTTTTTLYCQSLGVATTTTTVSGRQAFFTSPAG